MANHKPHDPAPAGARAHISHAAKHTRLQFGSQAPYLNPHHEVPVQNEPTAEHPVSQHKKFKGHGEGPGAHIPTPHLKGTR